MGTKEQIMSKMKVVSIFPTAIGQFEFPRAFNKKEIDFVNKLEKRRNHGNWNSVNNYVLRRKEMKEISMFIEKAVTAYFKLLHKPIDDLEIYITQSWFNYASKGEWHHQHAHPNSYLSGVLYFSGDDNSDTITFHKNNYNQISPHITENTYYNAHAWTFPAKIGTMVVFPSGLQHSVNAVTAETQRISLAFNTFLRGTIGNNVNLTELILE